MGKRPKLDRPAPPPQRPVDAVAAAAAASSDPRPAQLHPLMAPGPLLSMDALSAMEVESPGAGPPVAAAANASLNPVGMQIYWNLSSLDMAVREAAALALVRELRAKQDEFAAGGGRGGVAEVLGAKENDEMLEGCAPAVQYALRRLVRGLGSSRECARQGFATALTAVVGALPVLRGEALLRIIPLNLEVTSSMKKQDARDGLLGRLFAYGSLVRARRLIGNGTSSEEKELAKEIVEQLFTLAKQKTFLREPAVNLVIELGSRLPSSAVRETVCAAPLFDEWLRRDVESQSPEALLLALHLHDKLPAQSSPLLPESGNLQDLFEPSHLAKLVPCLKESSSSHPRVHSVWHLLLDLLLSPPVSLIQESAKKKRAKSSNSRDAREIKRIEENLANFWSIAVDGALLSSSHERKNLAMELLLLVLPRLPNAESVGIVLSNILVRCILDILSSKDSHLHKSAQRCLSELRLWAESSNLRRAAVIVGLQKSSYGKFDTLSKTTTVKALTMGLTTEEGALAFIHNLEELFVAPEAAVGKVSEEPKEGSEDAVMNGHDKPGSNDRIWIVEQMCALCRQVKLEPKTAQASLYRAVIQFLVTHSAFESNKQQNSGVAEKKGVKWPQKPLAVNIRKLCVERLHSILVDAEQFVFPQKSKSIKAGGSGVNEAVTENEDYSLFAALYCLKLQKSLDAALVQPFKEETAESVKILQQTVATLSSAVKSETNVDRIRRLLALRTLLSHLLLESFLEPGSTDDIAAELVICCSKAFPDLSELLKIAPSVEQAESDEVPPVMDVLLDVLLSLLAKGSAPVRLAAEKVFKVYCEDFTSAGINDILRIINKGSKSGRHKSMLEDGEDDEDDDDDILEDDEDEEVDGDLGKTVEKQGAKVEGEDDDEDDDDDEDEDDEDDENGEDVEMGDGESRTLQQQMRFKRPGEDLDDEAEGSDSDSDVSDMDDEAMFRADVLLANVLKHRKEASKTNSQTELAHFKFRVLSLLEYFLKKHPGSSLVLIAVQGLVKAFVSAINQLGTASEENEVLIKRLESILQSKVLKVKKYPREKDLDLALARKLLMQTWKLASRSSIKRVRKLAQGCTLWTLKVLLRNEEKGDDELLEFFASSLDDYFTHKKSRLPGPFLSKVFQRHPMLGRFAFGRLISRCGDGRTEVMKCEAMRLISGILKPLSPGKGKKAAAPEGEEHKQVAKTFEEHMASLGAAILAAVRTPPQKADYKVSTLLFCRSCIDAFTVLYPQKPLHTLLDTGALLAGLKAIEAPSKGRLHNLLTKLVGTVTAELEKNPVSSEVVNDTKTTLSKKKKEVKPETSETPSKRKKARDEVEEAPSKKQQQQPKSAKKAKVPKDSS